MFKKEIKSPQFWLTVLSIALYLLSLFFTPFYVANKEADIYSNSFYMLLSGWMAVLGGGLFLTVIWLANPLYIFGTFLVLNKEKFAVIPVTLSLLLAIYFTTLDSVIDGESGKTTAIKQLGAGFYIWILSFVMMFIAGVLLFRNEKLNKF